jgi:putative SOS response-associated peptidase YedK
MCGRYTIKFTLEEANKRFQVQQIKAKFTPSYNVAPSQNIPIIYSDDGKVTIDVCRWGLIPHWAKEPNIGYKMINARIETINEKHTYNKELIGGRCLIPASGFIEWIKIKGGKKPMYIHTKSEEIFAFAGISSSWKDPGGNTLKTFMKNIHDRMPAILQKTNESKWISRDLNDKKEILKLIQPYSEKDIEAYEISDMVNSPANNNPGILQRI